ncbi:ABC transporter permease [Tabrizicola oligotrophica]|uniref:ABC transporter permease subunit n=1 Tax=Tabrizicola oligotrophica TaxID=2710650 RepID=A0A6M0QWD8_9RHOB|nr:ABC transporter permease subunit [Tabrizicola oligotrophica]NEY91788.1 ABC transporter permease subunit [Tabrizicola oligotrophica]
MPWLAAFPQGWTLPLADVLNTWALPVFDILQGPGRALAAGLDLPLRGLRAALEWLPWPALAGIVVLLALRASGWQLAVVAIIAQAGIVAGGYWPQAMNTLAIVLMSLPPAVLIGFALGAAAHRWPRIEPATVAALDVMQTLPAFAYLIPLLILFGFGPAPGLVAGVVFAVPPMVRNTILGLARVPAEVVEAAQMCGATSGQLFWLAKVPAARSQLLVGVNQTVMASLSMVIIVAVIGGFNDIGWEVLSAMRGAELGRSLMSGLVIVAMAILLDRITLGFASPGRTTILGQKKFRIAFGAFVIAGVVTRLILPEVTFLPDALGRNLARSIDATLMDFVVATGPFFAALRDGLNYGLMLPLRIGLLGAATPTVWGFTLMPWMIAAYAIVFAGGAFILWRRTPTLAIAILFVGLALATGITRFPWPGVVAMALVAAWASGGPRLFAMTSGALGLIIFGGLWAAFTQSAYLTALAVVLCVLIGGALGLLAAENDRASAILRPINDALQTMPQFVFLIPALMLFRVGEFTALIAIMLYAIVPPMRYVEHGLRNVSPALVEAAVQMGATRSQLLWQVKLPLARPVIRLGINQTIMAAISMLVIAALVGTRDLGQQVFIALGKADLGLGLVAGFAIALLALIADRLLRD